MQVRRVPTGLCSSAPRISLWIPKGPVSHNTSSSSFIHRKNRTLSHAAGSAGLPSDGPSPSVAASTPGFVSPELGSSETNGVFAHPPAKKSFLTKVKEYFMGSKDEKNKLASLGMGAFASYGFISNLTYCACLTVAWITFVKATGNTPLMEGQWKPFLAFYAGLWTVQNFVRPARFALAVALAPQFDKLITGLGGALRIPKPAAFSLFLVLMATVTVTSLFLALWAFGGFPYGLPFFTKT